MKKEVLEKILNNPHLEKIYSHLQNEKAAEGFCFTSRVCPDPKYGTIPTVMFRLRYGDDSDRRMMKLYSVALRYVLDRVDIPDARRKITITYGHINSQDKNPFRNVDIYLKVPEEEQAAYFDKLAEKFEEFLGRVRPFPKK